MQVIEEVDFNAEALPHAYTVMGVLALQPPTEFVARK